jgi:hypothetical protein
MIGTWIGVVLGLGLLLTMAFSSFVLEIEDKLEARDQRKTTEQKAATVNYPH